jgi:hypothetical protein
VTRAEAPPPRRPARFLLTLLSGAGLLVLAGVLLWVWRHSATQLRPNEQIDALAQQVGTLEARIARLEQRSLAQPPDLTPLAKRLTELEQHAAAATGQTPDLGPLTDRVVALEQRQQPNLAPLEARIATLETKAPADSELTARIDARDTSQRATQAELGRRLDAVERSSGQTAALADRVERIAQVQTATLALDAGQKLGHLPGAPPALARFADVEPPTEASLRLAFPRAAHNALAASQPAIESKRLLARLWAQAEDLVMVRQGDHVLVGDPTAGVLERARTALDAGDPARAVAAVATLTGPAAQSMAPWLADARALLEARTALATWAAHG